jgi:hypothetical protein
MASNQDITQIEHEVFPDICNHLVHGFRNSLDKQSCKKIQIGTFDDESVHTIDGEEFEIILHNVDDIPLDDICAIASEHPCYLLTYMDKGLIRLRYTWVEPKVAKVKRRTTSAGASRSSSFWTTRRVLVLIVLVALLTAFRAKLLSLVTTRWQ